MSAVLVPSLQGWRGINHADSTHFGTLLKRHRLKAGLSQEALAERARMSARGVSDLERDVRRAPYRDTIAQLATALELDDPARAALEQAARRVRAVPPRVERGQRATRPRTPSVDDLLATKLGAPTPRTALVRRPRLLQRLDAVLTRPLVLLSAPAGTGKTTLLGAWSTSLEDRDVSVAWVSLDAGDNDVCRFGRYVLTALQESVPAHFDGVLELLQTPQLPPTEIILTALVNALATVTRDIVLILEDYHLVTAPAVHDAVSFLLDHLPPPVHVVISTRADPPLPLARLRAGGLVTELRIADLRFTPDESAAFLTEVMGLSLGSEEIGVLETRTEGWIAGLQLAALSLKGRSPDEAATFIHAFTGSHRHVVDYLIDEVFARQPEPVQAFLLRTSILGRMCASLCAFLMDGCTSRIEGGSAVNTLTASQELLEELERSNLFVVALDDHRAWYRFHHLFADAMRHRLQHQHPDIVPELHGGASRWFEEQGLLDEAIDHALEARAFEHAAELLEHMLPALHARGERLTMENWLERLPRELMQARPRLLLVKAWTALDDGAADAAEHFLHLTDQARQAQTPRDPGARQGTEPAGEDRNLDGEVAAARALAATTRNDPARAIVHARRALDCLDPDNAAIRGLVGMTLGLAHVKQQELEKAACAFGHAHATVCSLGNKYLGLRVMLFQSYVQRGQGRMQLALRTCEQALAWSGGYSSPVVGLLHMQVADLLRESNHLSAALRHAEDAIPLTAPLEVPEIQVFPGLVLARVRQAQGNLDGALAALRQAAECARTPEVMPYRSLLDTQEAHIRLMQGDVTTATELVQKAEQETDMGVFEMHPFFVYAYEHPAVAPIQVLLAQWRTTGDDAALERALGLLDHHRERAERIGMLWYRIKILALQALAHDAVANRPQALADINRALVLAHMEGYVRVFADEGEPMAALLRAVDAPGVATEYLQRVIHAASSSGTDIPPASARDLLHAS